MQYVLHSVGLQRLEFIIFLFYSLFFFISHLEFVSIHSFIITCSTLVNALLVLSLASEAFKYALGLFIAVNSLVKVNIQRKIRVS